MAEKQTPAAADGPARDVASIKHFCSHLSESGLVNGDTIRSLWDSFDDTRRPRNAQEFAQELVRQKRLTAFQYERLQAGEGNSLKLDQYTIVDRIGADGMGEVLKARHDRMQRYVAVKIISEKLLDSPESLGWFHQEWSAAAQLSHPNIVAAYDAGEKDGIHYLVLEYVDGQDLSSILAAKGPLRVALALDYIIQTAEGLQYSHRKGIVHRDIKPANLLVDSTGVVKILDMGLAFMAQHSDALEETTNQRLTQQGQVMGTCAFMAPEQAIDIREADERSDIYSLGCTMYDLLVGRPPYDGKTHMAIIVAHREDPIPSICAHRDEVPAAVDQVFQKMVAKRPEDRYTSMGEVIAALRGCTMDHPSAASNAAPGSSPAAATPAPARKPQVQPAAEQGGGVAVAAPAKESSPVDDTFTAIAAGHDTVVSRGRASRGGVPQSVWLAGAALLLLMLVGGGALAVALSLRTPQGTLVVESDDPEVQISVKQNGELVEIIDANDGWKVGLKEGEYELEVTGGKDQVRLEKNVVTVHRGETQRMRATFTPAVAARDPVMPRPGGDMEPVEPAADIAGPIVPPVVPGPGVPAIRPPGLPAPIAPATDPVVDAIPKLSLVHSLTGRRREASDIAFSSDGSVLASCGRDGHVVMWNAKSGEFLRQFHVNMSAWGMALSPDGKLLAAVGDHLAAAIYDAETGALVHELSRLSEAETQAVLKENKIYPLIMCAAFSPDGSKLLTGDNNNLVQIWDTTSGELIAKLDDHVEDVMSIEFSPSSNHFATASWDGTSQIWDAKTNKALHMLRNDRETTAYDIDFSPDGAILYSAGNATEVVAWDVETGERISTMRGHGSPVIGASVSADGKLSVSVGAGDKSVRFWDAKTGGTLSVLRNSPDQPRVAKFSPGDPSLLATVSGNAGIRLLRYEGEEEGERGNIRVGADGLTIVHQEVSDDHLSMPPWQSFKAPIDGVLVRVELQPALAVGAEGDLSIYGGEGTGGEKLHTQRYRIADTGDDPWKAFELVEPVALHQGVTYTVECGGAIGMYHSKVDRYGDGRASQRWGGDMAFRLYFKPDEE